MEIVSDQIRLQHLALAMLTAIREIGGDWSRCDKESGDDCKGIHCTFGEHRAVAVLENALVRYGNIPAK